MSRHQFADQPPVTLQRVRIGRGWRGQWRRTYIRGNAYPGHSWWTNGDKSRPWFMLAGYSWLDYAVDVDRLKRMHQLYRIRQLARRRRQ